MKLTEFIKNNIPPGNEIVFFGGTFNPWHSGHSSCLKLMDEQKHIIVLPDHNPFKDLTLHSERFSTLEDIAQELKIRPNKTYLYDSFLTEDNQNPTHQWLRDVRKVFPKTKLSLLMGFDSFMSLDKWIEAQEILTNLHCIYVASRLEKNTEKEKQFYVLKSLSPQLKIDFIGRHQYEHLSSTQLREPE